MKHSNVASALRSRDTSRRLWALAFLVMMGVALQLSGCAAATDAAIVRHDAEAEETLAKVYGIRVEGLHLSAAGSMLDFRYRVLDPVKAAPILDSKMKPYLLDTAHGAKLGVPDTPVLGRIRQTSRNNKIHTDRTYFIMFGNPGKAVQSGDKVSLLLGELKITDVTVR